VGAATGELEVVQEHIHRYQKPPVWKKYDCFAKLLNGMMEQQIVGIEQESCACRVT
jgi:hypothetical protein